MTFTITTKYLPATNTKGSRIRAAIEDEPKEPRRILTVRGVGYVFAKKQDADVDAR